MLYGRFFCNMNAFVLAAAGFPFHFYLTVTA